MRNPPNGCPKCESGRVVRNGHTTAGKQTFLCRDCGKRFISDPVRPSYAPGFREEVVRAALDSLGLRGAQRAFGVHRNTITRWARQVGAGQET